jgi:hypothetical protein
MNEAAENQESPTDEDEEGEGWDAEEGAAPEVVLLTLPGGGNLRKRVLREGSYQPSPSAGEACLIAYREKKVCLDDSLENHDATSFAVEHERVRVLLASAAEASSSSSFSPSSSSRAATTAAAAPDALTLEPPPRDLPGSPPTFARPPPHLDALLRSMRPFERCAFTLSSPQPPTTTTTDADAAAAISAEVVTAAGEVELHCVLGGACELATGGDDKSGAGKGGVTVRVISRSTAAEDRYPARVNADSRVRLMVTEAPDEGCCGGGGGGKGRDGAEAAAAEECVEFDVGDGTAMEGLETAATAGGGNGNGLQVGDVALVTIRGEYTLPDVPAHIPEDLLPLAKEAFHLQVRVASVGAARKGKIAMSAAERVAWGARLREMGTALFKAGRCPMCSIQLGPIAWNRLVSTLETLNVMSWFQILLSNGSACYPLRQGGSHAPRGGQVRCGAVQVEFRLPIA